MLGHAVNFIFFESPTCKRFVTYPNFRSRYTGEGSVCCGGSQNQLLKRNFLLSGQLPDQIVCILKCQLKNPKVVESLTDISARFEFKLPCNPRKIMIFNYCLFTFHGPVTCEILKF
jgi:hypothetical protein